ncbi:E3 ubiquitin-protein ligase TTC3 isoform X1 [Dasypus novemcinctus]|uniref:E3 ubiquitin-protein ligase TTC3 isoform X1 n=1 Tax=Dasypus novemcinctus TaxID=9361 RepID=UPI00265FA1E1|nr:E3 ubiquitin-protein ligase TTC3 isoform X2 [Dasypus novemcinctus]
MAELDEGDFTIGDYALLEDYVHDSVDAPGFITNDYVRVTQLYCDGVGKQCKDYTQSEKNVEFDICSLWCSKPVSVLHDYCDAIKVYVFWPLLFQRQQSSVVSRLHPCVDTGNSHAFEMSLKRLQYLELMEDIVDLAKKVVNDSFFIGGLLRIGYKIENKILAMEEALNWVKYTGDLAILPKLGTIDNCWPMLSIFFTEYKYHITKVVTENCNLLEEFKTQNCADCIEQGELMKMKGNEEFSKERFDIAIIYYTRAIEYRPENHLLYGNRALCFLRTGQIRNALGDGKRATILKNSWPKGHYRYCDALSLLGEYDWALQANIKAQKLCKNDPEGIKELIQQHVKLQKQIEELQGRTSCRNQIRRGCCEGRACVSPKSPSAPAFSTSLNFVEREKDSKKTAHDMARGGNHNSKVVDDVSKVDGCDCPGFRSASGHAPRHKGRHRSRHNELEKSSANSQLQIDLKNILDKHLSKSARAAHQDFSNIMKMLRGLMQDGYTALLEQRCRSAAQAFTELLNGLDPQKIKQLNLAMINYVLVVYGLAISLLGIGQPEELSEAENQFKRMLEFYPNEGLDCLAYCGIGKVYLKKNRFVDALTHFEKARTLIGRLPGVLTWPTSNVVIEETRPGKIKMVLERFIEECRFPPVPDAICSYQKCNGYSKIQIYISDPDFKGFIRISCCQYCKIEFHMNCWKKLKTTTFDDKIDKDFLQGICLTPDCEGVISKIIIFNRGGRVKCEFEHKVIKEKVPPRPILKQKCSSLVKQRLKEDKKVLRKIQRVEAKKLARERLEEDLRESNPPEKEEKKETAANIHSCRFLDDRILQCLSQYSDKIKAGILNPPKLLKELLSWKVLSFEDYSTCLSRKNYANEVVDFAIGVLVQQNNRVKTRIFLHVLSELEEVEPKLATWIQKLNSFGLDATGPFLARYGASLKELDFSIMAFLWNEKYGPKMESLEGKSLDYFFEPTSLTQARCLIWLLEDHRERFPALHSALDEFFDILDSRCTVLRKHDNQEVPFTSTKKHKSKKKKQKDSKPMLVGSGTGSIITSSEMVTSSEDHKSSSSSAGPFVVPEHLRKEVEEFEALYQQQQLQKQQQQQQQQQDPDQDQQNTEYVVRSKKAWEINPKQKNSTLYDYFSQFLEEHGPLDMGNRIFSEEYEFFPEETRQILEKAGGLKPFLLGCPRFVVIDNCIALKKVASRLKKKRRKKGMKAKVEEMSKAVELELYLRLKLPLDPAAREFTPDTLPELESDLPSAPASEDAIAQAEPADAPEPAPAEAEPAQVPEDSAAAAAGTPEVVASGSADAVSEDADHEQVSPAPRPSSEEVKPKPVAVNFPAFKEVKTAFWAPSHLVTGYCAYLPFQGFDITQTPPAYIGLLPSVPQFASIYTPVAALCPEYQLRAAVPVVPAFVANRPGEGAAAACCEGPRGNAEEASGEQVAPESHCSADEAGTALEEPSGEAGGCGNPAEQEADAERARAARSEPCTQEVAVQVDWNVSHQGVNTEPFSPFEAEQGGILQIQKDYRAIGELFKKACDKYMKTKRKGLKDAQDLEEMLQRNLEESKISKTELDWFLQDLEKEIRKWLQEKREIQERLIVLKKKIIKLLHAEFNAFIDEDSETEEILKEERAQFQESLERAVAVEYDEILERAMVAEVSVLENWKEMELCRLQSMESRAEAYLKHLRRVNSNSAVCSKVESNIRSWEAFLDNVRIEIENAKSQFEEQIRAIKNGSRLKELSGVQIAKLSFPAYNVCRCHFLLKSSGHRGRGLVISTSGGSGEKAPAQEDSGPVAASNYPTQKDSGPVAASDSPAQKDSGVVAASDCPAPKDSCVVAASDCPAQKDSGPVAASDCPAPKDSGVVAASDCPAQKDSGPVAASDCPAPKDSGPVTASDCPAPKDSGVVAASNCPAQKDSGVVAASDCPAQKDSGPVAASDCPAQKDSGPVAASGCSAQKDSGLVAASNCPVVAPSEPLPAPPSNRPAVAQLPKSGEGPSLAPQSEQSLVPEQKPPAPLGRAARSGQGARKPFNSIIEHLSMALPCYSSTELAGFIKKVRSKNKNSLSGLSVDEIVQKVTEHILDEQNKRKPNPGNDKWTSEPSSESGSPQGQPSVAARTSRKTKGQKMEEDGSASVANSCEICQKVLKSKNTRVLKCGHKFHKGCFRQWLTGQSACPACRGRDRLSEA